MTTTTETGGPAFPQPNIVDDGELIAQGDMGMTLRDYFAAKAMQAFLSADVEFYSGREFKNVAESSYQCADAMLREQE